jgi:hypothetical protein
MFHKTQSDDQAILLQINHHILPQQSPLNMCEASTGSTHISFTQEGGKGNQHGGENHHLKN